MFVLVTVWLQVYGVTWTINSSGFAFSPDVLTINQGDDVKFVIESSHNAVEVSKDTWTINDSSPVTGFTVSFGGGTVSSSQLSVGTHYYVCEPHASFGMKGTIVVQSAAGVDENSLQNIVSVYPNPTSDKITLRYITTESKFLNATLYDIQGKFVSVLFQNQSISGGFQQSVKLKGRYPSGVYFLKISISGKETVKKLVIL